MLTECILGGRGQFREADEWLERGADSIPPDADKCRQDPEGFQHRRTWPNGDADEIPSLCRSLNRVLKCLTHGTRISRIRGNVWQCGEMWRETVRVPCLKDPPSVAILDPVDAQKLRPC